jgi:hypothetical protein
MSAVEGMPHAPQQIKVYENTYIMEPKEHEKYVQYDCRGLPKSNTTVGGCPSPIRL